MGEHDRVLMVGVASGSIVEIGFDPRRGDLYVRFHEENALYRYEKVPSQVWEAFAAADSKGAYHNRFLRDRYAWHRVEEPTSA